MTQSTHPSNSQALRAIQRRWWVYAISCLGVIALAFVAIGFYTGLEFATRWLILTSLVMTCLLTLTWKGLHLNHRPGENNLIPRWGAGNTVTLVRGVMIAMLAGFLFSPEHPGWLAWIPGLLYILAILGDFLDGALARLTQMPTRLGEFLDMEFDSLGVLTAASLCVFYQQSPYWYLLIGLARYVFIGGLWLRQRLGLSVHELPPSIRRRLLAGIQMSVLAFLLMPVIIPPGSLWAATAIGLPMLVGFVWDWLLAIGKIRETAERNRLEWLFAEWTGFIFRWLTVGMIAFILLTNPTSIGILGWNRFLEIIVALFISLGVLGRFSAFTGLMLLGAYQVQFDLSSTQLVLTLLYCGILMLGTGPHSLWSPEDRLVHKRIGDDHLDEDGVGGKR